MGPIGMPEMVVIAVIALIIFGPRKLPELGKSLGKSIAEFKRASNELKNTLEEEIRTEELQDARKSAQIPPTAADASVNARPRSPRRGTRGRGDAARERDLARRRRSAEHRTLQRATCPTAGSTTTIPRAAGRCRFWSTSMSSGSASSARSFLCARASPLPRSSSKTSIRS